MADWEPVYIRETLMMDAFVEPGETNTRKIVYGMTEGIEDWFKSTLSADVYIDGWCVYPGSDGTEGRDGYLIRCQSPTDAMMVRMRWS